MSGSGQDGSIDDLPWASVFDPAANARALSAIQAEGFRAASRIVDRFVRAMGADTAGSADGPTGGLVDGAPGDAPDGAGGAGLPEFERLTRAWWSTAGQFLLRAMPAAAKPGGVALDVNGGQSAAVLRLEATAGSAASAEVWLHNTTATDLADVRLHGSDLLSHDGEVIGADALRLDTAVVEMPRRSSRGVTVTVDVGAQVAPGVYRGTLLAGGYPDLWLPVTLTVRPSGT